MAGDYLSTNVKNQLKNNPANQAVWGKIGGSNPGYTLSGNRTANVWGANPGGRSATSSSSGSTTTRTQSGAGTGINHTLTQPGSFRSGGYTVQQLAFNQAQADAIKAHYAAKAAEGSGGGGSGGSSSTSDRDDRDLDFNDAQRYAKLQISGQKELGGFASSLRKDEASQQHRITKDLKHDEYNNEQLKVDKELGFNRWSQTSAQQFQANEGDKQKAFEASESRNAHFFRLGEKEKDFQYEQQLGKDSHGYRTIENEQAGRIGRELESLQQKGRMEYQSGDFAGRQGLLQKEADLSEQSRARQRVAAIELYKGRF